MFTYSDIASVVNSSWLVKPIDFSKTVTGIETDTRIVLDHKLFVAFKGDKFDAHDFLDAAVNNDAQAICVSRKPAGDLLNVLEHKQIPVLLVEDTLHFYQQLAKFHRNRFPNLKVVAITGSCGKTSAKEIVASLLSGFGEVLSTRANTNNHIGVPQNLFRLTEKHDFAVMELGSNHFGEIKLLTDLVEPDVAVVTNVGAAHLEFFGDLDGVAREKSSIYTALKSSGTAVVPEKLRVHPDFIKNLIGRNVITFGSEPADIEVDYLKGELNGSEFSVITDSVEYLVKWNLSGEYQALNAAAALAVVKALKLSCESAVELFSKVKLPGMRMKVEQKGQLIWVNDAYNANPSSVKAALQWLADVEDRPEKLWLVLGDMLEGGGESEAHHVSVLEEAVALLPEAHLIGVGPMMAPLVENFNGNGFEESVAAGKYISNEIASHELNLVFLKASRGIALEKIIDVFYDEKI